MQQQDENLSQALTKHEQRINNVRVDLNILEEQINQRISQVSLGKRKQFFIDEFEQHVSIVSKIV